MSWHSVWVSRQLELSILAVTALICLLLILQRRLKRYSRHTDQTVRQWQTLQTEMGLDRDTMERELVQKQAELREHGMETELRRTESGVPYLILSQKHSTND